MIDEALALNARIAKALDALPPADPLTLASTDGFGESQVRKIIERECLDAPEVLRLRMLSEYFGAGPIEPLLADARVTEIITNGAEQIWCERDGKLARLGDRFLSALTYRNFLARVSREAGVEASLECPFADGHWRGCRTHLAIPPAASGAAVLTIRKHPPLPWTFATLAERGWASGEAMLLLRGLVANKKNFLIVGSTGSGKTSVLNACLGSVGSSERTMIIEDTPELAVPNAASAKLLTRRDPHRLLRDIDQGELLKQALRMRPDRIVMGEIRGGEAKDLLMAFATGHTGCMGTLHADSPRQALLRLEMLIQLGAPQWAVHAVRTLIWLSVQAIVVVARSPCGARRLEGIYEIASLEDLGFLIDKKA